MVYEGGDHKTADQGYVWLQAKVRELGLGRRPGLYTGSVCVAQRHYSCSMQLVTLYKCYAFILGFLTLVLID